MRIPYKQIRDLNWSYKKKKCKKRFNINIYNFHSEPYTYFKAVLYIEISSILIFFFQNSFVTPNSLTILYALLGLLSGILLATGNENLILIGLLIIFFKGIIDWSDGLLARLSNKTSLLGSLLDEWAGLIGSYSFIIGYGFYLYNKTNEIYFIILSIIIIAFRALDIKNYFYLMTTYRLYNNEINKIQFKKKFLFKDKSKKYNVSKLTNFIKKMFSNILDDRSRSIDFVCLLIFLDLFYFDVALLNYVFFILVFKYAFLSLGSFYLIYFRNYIDKLNLK